MIITDGRPYLRQIKEMITVYTDSLARDLAFQDLADELAHPENKYFPPEGEVVVAVEPDATATDGAKVLGMVAYHRHSDDRCEMKRLFVYPEYRGAGIGEQLVTEILRRAKSAGYREMVLDTLEPMTSAIALYRKLGFEECGPYYHNPFPDVIYMKKTF